MIIVAAAVARLRNLTATRTGERTSPCAIAAFADFTRTIELDRQRVAAAFRDCLHQFDMDGTSFA